MVEQVNLEEYSSNPPIGYVSEQERANKDPTFLISLLERKVGEGFEEIPPEQLLTEPTDQEFVYINSEGKYCSGGWLRFPQDPAKKEDCHTEMWVLYSARNRRLVSLQLQPNSADSPWAVRVFIRRELVGYKRPTEPTNHPVYLPDRNGNQQIVYYGKRAQKAERFMSTGKFARAQLYGWYFID